MAYLSLNKNTGFSHPLITTQGFRWRKNPVKVTHICCLDEVSLQLQQGPIGLTLLAIKK
jgi:hypothetical protein